jgi:hypothetical protein
MLPAGDGVSPSRTFESHLIGPNDCFRIGHTTLPPTQSVCSAGNDDINRQLGASVLSHFRIIFNHPASTVIFEKYFERVGDAFTPTLCLSNEERDRPRL